MDEQTFFTEQIQITEAQPAPVRLPRGGCPRQRARGRDLALAAALLAACFLLWDALLWAGGLGLGEALGLAALLPAALVYLRRRPGRMRGFGWICAALYLLGAVSLAFSGDGVLKALTFLALAPLFLLTLMERLQLWTGSGLRARLRDFFCVGFGMSYGRIGKGSWALTHTGDGDSPRSKRAAAVSLGLLCALPALLVLVPLLIASDAAFAGLVGKLDWSVAGRGLLAALFGGFLALLLFCLLFTSACGPAPVRELPRRGLEPAAVAAFLGAVSAAYALYLVSQFAYFTDAFRGLLPKDFTVAEYARRGFFEMCAIVAINLGLIAAALALCRKEGGKVHGAVKGLSLFLCLFSLALVATALSKMVLYMGSFGLTRLRVLTSAFMLFLAAVVAALGLRLFLRRVPVGRLAVALGAAMLIVLSLVNVDGRVARCNVDAWRSGRLDSLDVETVCRLGDGATPALIELSACGDAKIAETAQLELRIRLVEAGLAKWENCGTNMLIFFEDRTELKERKLLPNDEAPDLRSWNLISARARAALEAYWQP